MFDVCYHNDARKSLDKTQKRIRNKAFRCMRHLMSNGLKNLPFPIATLKGEFKKLHYFEIKLDKDFRLILRKQNGNFYIRHAGTHNQLGTG